MWDVTANIWSAQRMESLLYARVHSQHSGELPRGDLRVVFQKLN